MLVKSADAIVQVAVLLLHHLDPQLLILYLLLFLSQVVLSLEVRLLLLLPDFVTLCVILMQLINLPSK